MKFDSKTRIRALLWLPIIVLSLSGLVSTGSLNILPAEAVFEVSLAACILALARLPKRKPAAIALIAAAYVTGSAVIAIYIRNANPLDFLQAYKAFIYCAMLAPFVNRKIFDDKFISNLFATLTIVFLLKYGYERFFGDGSKHSIRPTVFSENNFELILLTLLYYRAMMFDRLSRTFWTAAVFAVVLLSGSRSAMLGIVIAAIATQARGFKLKHIMSAGVAAPIAGAAAFYLFAERSTGAGIESLDRFRFLLVFLEEIKNWSWYNYVFGTMPITPLSPSSCSSLKFWSNLFSFSDDGKCYSVILHSYLLRVIFDHGLVGLIFLSLGINWCLKYSGYGLKDRLVVLGVLVSSALSVSSFNNIFCALSLLIYYASPVEATAGQSSSHPKLAARNPLSEQQQSP